MQFAVNKISILKFIFNFFHGCKNFRDRFSHLRRGIKGEALALLFFSFTVVSAFPNTCNAQDSAYAKKIIDTLTSSYFFGRGYVNDGDTKAAAYIADRFYQYGITANRGGYFQSFMMDVNTFPENMIVKLDDKILTTGKDYIVSAESKGKKGKFKLVKFESIATQNADGSWQYAIADSKTILVIDDSTKVGGGLKSLLKTVEEKSCFGAAGFIELNSNKLTMDMSMEVKTWMHLIILKSAFNANAQTVTLDIQNKLVKVQSQNVVGYIQGTRKPDSMIVLTAHYDHLGGLGNETYFPGANDNASGISMLLSLARYYSNINHRPEYTMVFIAFGGEEVGLIGSQFFVKYPTISLNKIRFLINMDIMGTGEEGIKVVNATEYKSDFDRLVKLNDEFHLLKSVQPRGKAANSDHYPFSEKGVQCFFIYTLGGISAYHDVYDRAETLLLTKFNDLEKLLKLFIDSCQ